jgi:hypothetical protein
MSLNFPVNPSDGDLYEGYIFDGTAGVWNSNPAQIASRFVTSASAPENPSEGDGWFDSTTAKSYTYYDGVWVQIGAPGAIRFNQLEGIEVTDPVDGEIIVYDSASSQWVNESQITTFGGLEDTSIATPATGDSLVYDGSDWTNQPLTTRRNLLYNGAMQVHQRGTSVTGITTGGYFTADRWNTVADNMGTWTQTSEDDAPVGSGLRKSTKLLCTTADSTPAASDLVYFRQMLEGQDVQRIKKGTSAAEQLTLSFWVKSNVTGTYVLNLQDADNTRQVSAQYIISASGAWEKKTISFPADDIGAFDNDNSVSLRILWFLGAGTNFTSGTLRTAWTSTVIADLAVGQVNLAAATNNYWQITGVQLEVGPVATPFEFKTFGQDLLECQRYYFRLSADVNGRRFGTGYNTTTTGAYHLATFPTEMRVIPAALEQSGTATDYSVNYGNFLVANLNAVPVYGGAFTNSGLIISSVASGLTAGQGSFLMSNNANSFLAWSAEL